MVEYNVAIVVTRVRFPADAAILCVPCCKVEIAVADWLTFELTTVIKIRY